MVYHPLVLFFIPVTPDQLVAFLKEWGEGMRQAAEKVDATMRRLIELLEEKDPPWH